MFDEKDVFMETKADALRCPKWISTSFDASGTCIKTCAYPISGIGPEAERLSSCVCLVTEATTLVGVSI